MFSLFSVFLIIQFSNATHLAKHELVMWLESPPPLRIPNQNLTTTFIHNHHHPHPTTTPPSIRSSSVARLQGLFLHSTDTWQTNECPFVWRDLPQIAPKMLHTGICLFFCFFNVCMCVLSFFSAPVQRNGEPRLPLSHLRCTTQC